MESPEISDKSFIIMIMKHIVLLLILFWGNLAFGQSCVEVGQTALTASACCPDLVFNSATNTCDIPNSSRLEYCAAPVAPALTSATVCSVPGYSCLPQREEDLFPETPDDSPLPESDNNETRKDEGELCEVSTDCESFLCAADSSGTKVCQERLVCRLAEVGELAISPAQCEEGLIKSREFNPETGLIEDNVCIDNTAASPFPDIDPNLFNQTGRCSYDIETSKRDKRFTSMVSLRAFEILFSRASDDKLKLKTYIREMVAKPLAEGRKIALDQYNATLKEIERDESLIKEAKADSTAVLTIHGSESVVEKDLALRRVSGKDMLLIMWRRNLMNMSYEQKMFELISTAAQKLAELNENIKSWRAKHKKWKISSDAMYSSVENGGKKIKKSYTTRHRIKPKTAALNSGAFEKPGVPEFFSILADGGITQALPKKKFYLLDAPFISSDGSTFGSAGPLQRNLSGSSRITSVEGIYDDFGTKIQDYYRSLLPSQDKELYVFEPEMVDLGEKNCFLADGSLSPGCPKFKNFLEGVQGSAFAEFIAYGAHRKGKYKKFFERSNTLRLRLLKTLEIEFQTIAQYYEELNTSRIAQNTCFSDSYNYVNNDLTDRNSNNEVQNDTRGPETFGPGGALPGSGASGAIANTSAVGSNALTGESLKNLPEAIRLAQAEVTDRIPGSGISQGSNTSLNVLSPNLVTNTNTSTGSSSGSSSTSSLGGGRLSGTALSSSNAISRDRLKIENNALKSRTQNSQKRSEEISRGFSSLAARVRVQSTNSSAISGLNASTFNGLGPETKTETDKPQQKSDDPALLAQSGSSVLKDISSAGQINYDETPGGVQYGGNSAVSGSGVDATGMNEEDKDVLMKNLERTRSKYEGQDTDELFERVSKAYVRNLHRILKRKRVD